MARGITFKRKLPWYFWIGFLSLLISQGMMLAKVEPVSTYFYPFIWWSYIILIDGLVFWIKGSSLFTRLKIKIFLLILCSAGFWYFFEILNIRINNWFYTGPSFHPVGRVIFGTLAFGTVLPAILETYEFLESLGLWRNFKFPQWKRWGQPHYLWIAIGIVMLVLSLIWPKYFFWTIWLAVIFILDPDVDNHNGKSLFSELRQGNTQTFYLLLLTGLICGALWEFWNYWTGLKWVYNVPFFGQWKVFEMPVLGYLGFPFFALECYIFYNWLSNKKADLERMVEKIKLT